MISNKSKSRQRGITLIALVISIIVLLILAGAAISMLSGENGILKRTTEAKEEYEFAKTLEEIKLKILSYTKEKDKMELNGFESIEYELPDKYKDKLLLKKGDIFISYLAEDNIKKMGIKNGIYTYYVDDESLKCLSNSTSIIYKDGEKYIWKDDSGNNNAYTICNYKEECVKKNGIQLSKEDEIYCAGNPYNAAKTAIITISNYSRDGKKYNLFRGEANNFWSYFVANEQSFSVVFRCPNIIGNYTDITGNYTKEYGDTIQIASTHSDDNFIQKIYINGELISSMDRGKVSVIWTEDIGRRLKYYPGYDANPGNYIINSVQLYSRELTENEIKNNYNLDAILYNIK